MKKGFIFDMILCCLLVAVFALWAIVLLNQSNVADWETESETKTESETLKIDTTKIKVITESPTTTVATVETIPQENETVITDELCPEAEKPVETAVNADKWTTPETQSETETTEETETTANNFLGTFKVTGYTAEEGFYEGKTTASGTGCREGICAMNRTRMKELGITYGDNITVEGIGTFTVADCGCSYNTVDIWCYTNAEAYALTGYYNVYVSE